MTDDTKDIVQAKQKPLSEILPSIIGTGPARKSTRGRHTTLTKPLIKAICANVEKALHYKDAAALANISSRTLWRYIHLGEQDIDTALSAGYTEAEVCKCSNFAQLCLSLAHAESKCLQRLTNAIEEGATGRSIKCPHCMKVFKDNRDWRAAAELTRMRYRDTHGKTPNKVNVNATNVQFQLNYEPLPPKHTLDE